MTNRMGYNTLHNVLETVMALGIVLLSAVGFMLLGMFIDIQIILKYNYTPISFTLTFLFSGALIGVFVALRRRLFKA
jgi:hypothetical protein